MIANGRTQQFLWVTALLVFLLLPWDAPPRGNSLIVSGAANADDASAEGDNAAGSYVDRKRTARRESERKFKFRKIERIYVDDYIEDETDTDDNDSNEMQDEENEYEDNRRTSKSRSNKYRTTEDDNGLSDEVVQDDDDSSSSSIFSSILDLFAGSESETAEPPTNNIITWLQWLGEKISNGQPRDEEQPTLVEKKSGWLAYLNRWPFNMIMSDDGESEMHQNQKRSHTKDDDSSSGGSIASNPLPDEYFDQILHSLPSFIANFSHTWTGACQQDLQIFHKQLRANKMWTLQIIDATGKVSSGLLRGYINQFGDFDLCTQTSAVAKVSGGHTKRMHSKYCLAQIEMRTKISELKAPLHMLQGFGLWNSHISNPKHFVPRYTVANWGVCVPNGCSSQVVQEIMETNLRAYNNTGIKFYIKVEEDNCGLKRRANFIKLLRNDRMFGLSILALTTLSLSCLFACLWEQRDWLRDSIGRLVNAYWPWKPKDTECVEAEQEAEDKPRAENEPESVESAVEESSPLSALLLSVLNEFSPKRTFQTLVSLKDPELDFPFFHLLKIGAILMLYVSLKFIMVGHLPLINRDSLVQAVESYWSLLFRLPLLYSDLLLVVSGFLAAYQLSLEMEQKSQINFLKNVALRASRYLLTMYVLLGFQTWILPHLGAGPLWGQLVRENARFCEQNMWRPAMSLHNLASFEESCSPPAVSLSLDVQLYLLGPLFVWLFHTDSEAGFFIYGAINAISIAARFSRSNQEHLAPSLFHGIHVSKFYRTANMIYASPISRATPYLLGIGGGLLYRSENGLLNIAQRFRSVGWSIALVAIAWCFWAPSAGMRSEFVYSTNDAASYLAWSPLIMGLAICWCIFMFQQRSVVPQGFPYVAQSMVFLSRMAFPLQLAIYLVVLWNTASAKEPQKFQITDLMDLSEVITIVIAAIAVAFLIDIPSRQIRCMIIEKVFKERLQKDTSVSATSEANKNQDDGEKIKEISSDTTWVSDADADADADEQELASGKQKELSSDSAEPSDTDEE